MDRNKIDHVYSFPPNIDAIDAAFQVRGNPRVIYAYAPAIHNPHELHLPPYLIEHEKTHIRQQGADPATWWELYIEEESFRYHEELAAHAAEWAVRKRSREARKCSRDGLLHDTARRLMAPFYNYKPERTVKQAAADLLSCNT